MLVYFRFKKYFYFVSFFKFVRFLKISFLFSNYKFVSQISGFYNKSFYLNQVLVLKKQNTILKKRLNTLSEFFSFIAIRKKKWRSKFRFFKYFKKLKNLDYRISSRFNEKKKLKKYYKFFNFNVYNYFYFNYFKRFKYASKLGKNIYDPRVIDFKKRLKSFLLENRKIYSIVNFGSLKKAKAITRSINLKSKQKIWWNIVNFDKYLYNILISSRLVYTYYDSFIFIKNKYVYMNRFSVTNPHKILSKGDCIELIINKKYFFYIRYLNKLYDRNLYKLRCEFRYKMKNKKSYVCSNYDRWNRLFRDNYFFRKKIPLYLEVDFFVLSVVFVRDIVNIFDLSFVNRKIISYSMYKLYNWKWIS